jgi:hypothetical protein
MFLLKKNHSSISDGCNFEYSICPAITYGFLPDFSLGLYSPLLAFL